MYKFWVSTSSTITMQGSCEIKYQKNRRSIDIYLHKNHITSRNDQKEILLYINLKQMYLITMHLNGGGYILVTAETEAKWDKNMI